MSMKAFLYITQRDFPDGVASTCFLCKRSLLIRDGGGQPISARKEPVVIHLDDNRRNHSYENLALVHRACRTRKRTSKNYQILAREKATKNKEYALRQPKRAPKQRMNTLVDVGRLLHKLTKRYLKRRLPDTDAPAIPVDDICDEVGYLAHEKYHCGSQAAIERHLHMLCSNGAKWKITDARGIPVVSRRHPLLTRPARAAERPRKQGRRARRRASAGDRGPAGAGSYGTGDANQQRRKAHAWGRSRRKLLPGAPVWG